MPPRTGRARSWAALAALPSAAGAVCVLLLCGAFSSAHPAPWALLAAAVLGAVARWGLSKQRRPWYALEEGFVCALAVLALTQLAQPLQPLMYLLAAAYVLALPLRCAIPLLAALIALDAALTVPWPQMAAHASFAVLFAALYHALLGARLAAARRAEGLAVRKRIADAEARARELRLVAVSSEGPDAAERHLLGGVSEVEEVLRGALAVAEAALRPHTVACGVPLEERGGGLLGALVADRAAAFSAEEQRVLEALASEVTRAVEAERLLGAVRREKEEKARFFRALEELNKTTTPQQAAQTAIAQARQMCGALDLCAITLVEDRRHRVVAVEGEAASPLRDLSFGENAGLVSNVVKLGAPLPGRALGAMDRVLIFDAGTVVRGLAALKIFPLKSGESVVGTLVCGSRSPDALPEAAQKELAMLALQAAEALVRTRLYAQAERLATTDGLTGLLNRRTFNAQLHGRLREAERYQRPLSLVLIDIDHFKQVNDGYGHPAGDAVLRSVADLLTRQARETDIVARYGGEEMTLILPETDARGALAIAERIRKSVGEAHHRTEQGNLRVTISAGLSTWPGGGESGEELLEAADKALYRAKQAGRNRVFAANPASPGVHGDLRSVLPGSPG